MRLLSPAESNTKLRKSTVKQYRIVSLSLSPADIAGGKTNCPNSTAACRAACVGGTGVGLASVFPAIMQVRIRKTNFLRTDPAGFLAQLCDELERERRAAYDEAQTLVCRLNTFSDIPWESESFGRVPQRFSDCIFYDYTAIASRVRSQSVPANYSLCFSRKETEKSHRTALELLGEGFNVAIVFANRGAHTGRHAYTQRLPKTWNGFQVFDGDDTDLRFLDPGPTRTGRGRVCGLRLKSNRNEDRRTAIESGFAVLID